MFQPGDTGLRGPAEHERREQIVSAANEYFGHYGFEKTTVADLAKAIGLSKAYVYNFFDSKQAIGEAVCSMCLAKISGHLAAIAAEDKPATDKLRRIFRDLAKLGGELFFKDRKMHDLAAISSREGWGSTRKYEAQLEAILQKVLREGREAGEFERKTPLDETIRAVMLTLQTFKHPVLLQFRLDNLDEDATLLANLVLRSLAP